MGMAPRRPPDRHFACVAQGMNIEAAPAPPSAPSANTNVPMTTLASRLNLRWDMIPSLVSYSINPRRTDSAFRTPIGFIA